MAQLMPQPLTVSCFSKIQIGFTFLVPDHTGSLGKRAVNISVCDILILHKILQRVLKERTDCQNMIEYCAFREGNEIDLDMKFHLYNKIKWTR